MENTGYPKMVISVHHNNIICNNLILFIGCLLHSLILTPISVGMDELDPI
jgi:hypothetical protein